MQARLGEVAGGLGSAFPVDDVLTPHAFVDQSPLQRPRVQGEFLGDGVDAALPGGQQPSGEFGDPLRQWRAGRKERRLEIFGGDATGLRIGVLDAPRGQL